MAPLDPGAVLNGIAKFVALLVLVFVVLLVIGLARGDGLPANMVLTLDLRQAIADSASRPAFPLSGPAADHDGSDLRAGRCRRATPASRAW